MRVEFNYDFLWIATKTRALASGVFVDSLNRGLGSVQSVLKRVGAVCQEIGPTGERFFGVGSSFFAILVNLRLEHKVPQSEFKISLEYGTFFNFNSYNIFIKLPNI